VDFSMLKGRLAEALVESVFQQSGYTVARIGREARVEQLIMVRGNEHAPDFLARKRNGDNRFVAIEVKYRNNLPRFLRRYAAEMFVKAKERCRDLYVVLVTDRPEGVESCFQVVALRDYGGGPVPSPVDLCSVRELGISRSTIIHHIHHEVLVRRLFAALTARPMRRSTERQADRPFNSELRRQLV
jgi:hypothetical protein